MRVWITRSWRSRPFHPRPGQVRSQPPTAAPAQTQTTAKKDDPNEKICVKEESTGSRVSVKRVCMTRAEWADRKLQDQQELTRVQTQRGTSNGN